MTPENLAMHLQDVEWLSEAVGEMKLTILELWRVVDPRLAERYMSEKSVRLCEALARNNDVYSG